MTHPIPQLLRLVQSIPSPKAEPFKHGSPAILTTNSGIINQAKMHQAQGIGQFDALHVACAIAGQADLFITTDDRLINKMRKIGTLTTVLPGEAIALVENWYEN